MAPGPSRRGRCSTAWRRADVVPLTCPHSPDIVVVVDEVKAEPGDIPEFDAGNRHGKRCDIFLNPCARANAIRGAVSSQNPLIPRCRDNAVAVVINPASKSEGGKSGQQTYCEAADIHEPIHG